MVLWKERKEDGQHAVIRSFDTTIESKSYIKGFVAAIISFTDDVIIYIIEQYTCEPGVRKLKEILFEIIVHPNAQ